MARRVNIFGQPLSYDVGVVYVNGVPQDRQRPIETERDDVSTATKDTVVKYVKDLTHGVEGNHSNANAYPVGGQASVISVVGNDGTTPPLSTITNADGQFAQPFTRMGNMVAGHVDDVEPVEFDVPPSDLMQTYTGDSSFVKKGKSKSGEVDGHQLLADKDVNVNEKVLSQYVSPILSNNRFNSNRLMSSIDGHDKKFNPDHPPEGLGSYKKYAKVGTDMSDGQLANVGPMLTLRATKELNSIAREGYGQDGPDGSGAKASSLLPGLAQVGAARVSTSDLEVESVLKALIAGETDPVNITDGSSGPRVVVSMNSSYGQMNNVLEKFSGLLPLGMVAAGAALSIVLNIALQAILAIFLLITNASSSSSTKRDDIGRFIPGSSRYNPAFRKISFPPIPLPAKLFGLFETVNPFGDAVREGIKVFFGGSIGGSLTQVLESPGFYVVFCRNIVRSAVDLVRGLEDVGTGSPIAVAENIIAFIDVIKSSKVVAAMNMFAQIGDVSLLNRDASQIDNLEGLDAMRNRKPDSLALSWGAASTATTLLLPSNVAKAMMGGRPGLLTAMLSNKSNIEYTDSNRLSTAQVEAAEDALNAEYLPFYFHDLRTNEIVSFQAFLSNLTENFAANYDNIDGYGRIDTVKMYKNTTRKISVQFIVAATNKDDFDAMWVKINKLTTLVYPQWSKGTLLDDGDGSHFVQPFSQIPTASPLMRIRVGDLWTSNYSKFSLARIFGLGSDDTFKLKEFTHAKDDKVNEKITAIKDVVEQISNLNGELKVGSEWLLEPGDYDAAIDKAAFGISLSPPAARVTVRLRTYTGVKISKVQNSNAYTVEIVDKDKEGLPARVKDSKFVVSRSHLSFSNRTLFTYGVRESFLDEDPMSTNEKSATTTKLSDFFSSKNNAMVMAYESSKGRGLACMVESLDFDWFDGGNVMWETGIAGSRAPKMCKITMNMAVVHDIAPGIDASGFNRAPVYNVGAPSNAMGGRNPSNDLNNSDEGKAFEAASKKLRKTLI